MVPREWQSSGRCKHDATVSSARRDRVSAVCPDCPEDLAGLMLRYELQLAEETFARYLDSPERLIAYNEKSVLTTNILELLANPFSFLHRPLRAPSFPEIFGPDVFFSITKHLYRLALGDCKPLRTYRTPKDAVRAIVRRNPTAREFIESRLCGSAIEHPISRSQDTSGNGELKMLNWPLRVMTCL